mgnify:CR=1 FL=1
MSVLRFGDMKIHPRFATEHFAVIGASGSGKTTLINAFLASYLQSNRSYRALIYDPKSEMLPLLYTLLGVSEQAVCSGHSRVRVLNPYDQRLSAWDLARDFDSPVSVRELASILVPQQGEGNSSDSFFRDALRDILAGIMLIFVECVPNPQAWRFRDVLLALLYEPYTRFLLQLDRTRDGRPFPIVHRLRTSYFNEEGDPRTYANIRATINTCLSIFEPIAALSHAAQEAGRCFSLAEWASRDGQGDILVLANDEAARSSLDPYNQALFKRASELVLARREATAQERAHGENQTLICLDEVREAGKLEGLGRLLTKGRSKNLCVLLGYQDRDGMAAVYGKEIADEIVGQCNNIGILKLNNANTADWASDLFGRRLAHSQGGGSNYDMEGKISRSHDTGEEERPYVFTSDFLYLPPPGPQNGLHGYFRTPDIDPEQHSLRVHIPWAEVEQYRPQVPEYPQTSWRTAFRPQHASAQYLTPWDEADWYRLGLDQIVGTPVAYDAKPHHVPTVETQTKTLRTSRT